MPTVVEPGAGLVEVAVSSFAGSSAVAPVCRTTMSRPAAAGGICPACETDFDPAAGVCPVNLELLELHEARTSRKTTIKRIPIFLIRHLPLSKLKIFFY